MTDKTRKKIIREKIKYLETGCGKDWIDKNGLQTCGEDIFGLCPECKNKIKILKEEKKCSNAKSVKESRQANNQPVY
jgi:hypothetical protein